MPDAQSPLTISQSLFWYVAIGGAKTVASFAGYALMVLAGCPPQVALVLAHVVVTVLGYRGHAQLAFGVPGWTGLGWYALVTTVVYAVNAGGLAWLTAVGCGPLVAQAICQPVTIGLGFGLLRLALRPPGQGCPELPGR